MTAARMRQLKVREVVHMLEQLGFVRIRQSGSHAFELDKYNKVCKM